MTNNESNDQSSETNTNELGRSIVISAKPQYLEHYSKPEEGEYAFAYTINIHNDGIESVQLLSRHWIITDGLNDVREVEGEGVVGEQPFIEAQHSYRYSSGAILATRTGTMEGSYTFRSESGQVFQAEIPMFALIAPGALQ